MSVNPAIACDQYNHCIRTAFLTAAFALAVAGCRSAAPADRVAAHLEQLFNDLHARELFSGAAVVGRGDQILWARGLGFADSERHVLFTPDTPADSGALAQPLTAALVLTLAREGIVDLDAPVQRHVPELPYAGITLRHLLSHSSGIPVFDYDYFDPSLPPGRIRTTEALVSVLAEQKPPLFFEPGSAFEYSSLGFDIAALAASRATGKPYAALL